MSNLIKFNYSYKFIRFIFLILFIAVFVSINVGIAADLSKCVPGQSGGKTNPECPNGKISRNDISVNCMKNIAAASSCIDIMPAQNKNQVARIPEDVCHRNEGWSNKRNHNGMDYALPKSAGVVAAADGKVEFAGNLCKTNKTHGNGNHVRIIHEMKATDSNGAIVPNGTSSCFITTYLHLTEVKVKTGAPVKKGQVIGTVGGTGCRAGRDGKGAIDTVYPVHLHFEMRLCSGATINPMCDELQNLCPKPAGEEAASPNQCRNCDANAAACQPGNYVPPEGVQGEDFYQQELPSTKTCKISDYKNSFTVCIFCEIFKILFNTATEVSALAFEALSEAVSYVVIIATAIWISFTILRYISSFEAKEPRQMIKEILNKIFIVLFVLATLSFGPQEIMKWTLEPIFNTGMELAKMTSKNSAMIDCSDFQVVETGGLPKSMGINILCVVKTIQDSFLDILSLGSTAICIGFFEQSFLKIPIFPHFGYVLTGLGLWVSAILILIIYPWLLIDSVLKLSVAVSLLPAAVGAYAFNSTRKYTAKVWETFLNSMFNFVFLSIILFVLISMINDTIEKADMKELITDDLDPKSLLEKLGWWTTTFLQVCFAIILGWAVLGEGSSFASDFSGGMSFNQNIGGNVGTTAMSGVKGTALPVLKGAAKVGASASAAVGSSIKEKANSAKINRQAKSIKNSKHSTIDKDGNITQSYKNWKGQTVTRSLNVDANGNKMITNSKTDSKGNTTTTQTDKFMSASVTKDKNGNVTGENFEMKAAGTKYMTNKDGSLNQVAVQAMMQNSLHNPEMVQKAIMIQVMKDRFGEGNGLNKNFVAQNVQMTKDEKGNNVLEMVQKNKDGTTQRAKMVLGDKRALVELETTDKKGSASKTVSSDGVFKKEESKRFDSQGRVTVKSSRYDVEAHFKGGTPIDSLGTLSKKIQEAGTMYSENDINTMKGNMKASGNMNGKKGQIIDRYKYNEDGTLESASRYDSVGSPTTNLGRPNVDGRDTNIDEQHLENIAKKDLGEEADKTLIRDYMERVKDAKIHGTSDMRYRGKGFSFQTDNDGSITNGGAVTEDGVTINAVKRDELSENDRAFYDSLGGTSDDANKRNDADSKFLQKKHKEFLINAHHNTKEQ